MIEAKAERKDRGGRGRAWDPRGSGTVAGRAPSACVRHQEGARVNSATHGGTPKLFNTQEKIKPELSNKHAGPVCGEDKEPFNNRPQTHPS